MIEGRAASEIEHLSPAAVVFLGKEAGLAIMPALHDVQRDAIDVDAGQRGSKSC